ncbi:MAG: NADH:flavin oxidoreductase [Deltaproteobacteria bacterium]|nr:NADH:flavin oxidoreductase [Deltaproteobacteria bacterium]
MSRVFEDTEINGMKLANRFVRSATWEGMATEEGAATPRLADLMARLVEGGVGLIVSSHAYVRKDGQVTPWQLGVYDDGLLTGLQGMTRAVHDRGGRCLLQLAHGGLFANPKLTGTSPVGPSEEGLAGTPRKAMSRKDIREMVEAFGRAAERARDAGFDGVQIHAAHGYLLSQFLSPAFNRRKDAYGGGLEGRSRILQEVAGEIRSRVGKRYPLLAKINSEDFVEGGLTLEDSVRTAGILAREGVDAVECSGGTHLSGRLLPSRPGITSEDREAYFREAARVFRSRIGIPVILVGGIRSFPVAERLVEEGTADYISLSRPLIREPDLVKRWASGDLGKAACISDNRCFGPAMAGKGIYCVTANAEKRPTTADRGPPTVGSRPLTRYS